jgi:pyrimidine-nucleoside phosphorylase
MGKQMVALITDMNQPLGRMVGNALEVQECIEVLHGGGPADLRDLCLDLAAWMFFLGGASKTVAQGKQLAEEIIGSGKAFERFRQMVELQGGDISVIDDPTLLPSADHRVEVLSPQSGYVTAIQSEQVGTACVILGGGRERKEDSVDPAVGIVVHKKIGDKVTTGESLCTIHCHSDAQAARAKTLLQESYQIAALAPAHRPSLIHRVIYKEDH